MATARALWITGPGAVELREEAVAPGPDDVLVETLWSGISRGTEALVLRGGVPASEHARMRAPLQAGDFPWPVKYGYAAVGRVTEGPAALRGRTVFVLHPHQDRFAAPAAMAIPLPEGVPPGRAVLAANMETALNIVWDAGAAPGDRIAVVGAGTVGALVAWLCARLPGAEVTLVDVDPARAAAGRRARLPLRPAANAPRKAATASSMRARPPRASPPRSRPPVLEATVVEASWYGDRDDGGRSRRELSQPPAPARVEPGRAGAAGAACPLDNRRRLETALALLADPALDVLLTGETDFDALCPACMPRSLTGRERSAIASVIAEKGRGHVRRRGPRPHHDRPQPAGPGLRAGAGPARGDLRRRCDLLRRGPRPRTASSSTSASPPTSSPRRWRRSATSNLDAEPAFAGRLTTTEVLARHIFDALATAARAGRFADGGRIARIRVTLHESHVARAWYEGAIA